MLSVIILLAFKYNIGDCIDIRKSKYRILEKNESMYMVRNIKFDYIQIYDKMLLEDISNKVECNEK